MNRLPIRLILVAIGVVIGFVSLHWRTSTVINSSEKLIDSVKEVHGLLQSVHDAASAQSATPDLEESYEALYDATKDIIEQAKSADRHGGLTADGLQKIKDQVATFLSIMKKIEKEIDRLHTIRNLPAEFWNTVRAKSAEIVAYSIEVAPQQFPAQQLPYLRSVVEMINEFGPPRVVTIELAGANGADADRVAAQLKAKLGASIREAHLASEEGVSMVIGPIDDFDKLATMIEFGQVAGKDQGQRAIAFQVGTAPIAQDATASDATVVGDSQPGGVSMISGTTMLKDDPSAPPKKADWNLTSYNEMVAKFGKDRVARVEIVNQGDIVAHMTNTASAIASAAPEYSTCDLHGAQVCLAPVGDFAAFCQGLDFADIVARDDVAKLVSIRIDSAKLAARIAELKESPSLRLRAGNGGGPRPPVNFDKLKKGLAEHKSYELPDSSDPAYHQKLCDLLTDSSSFLRDQAIDALLEINPHDIQDKEVRKRIARNFRQLAQSSHGSTDKQRGKAIRGLALYGGSFCVPILLDLLESENLTPPSELFDALASFPSAQSAEAVSGKLGNFFCHDAAVDCLRKMGPIAEDALMKAAPSNKPEVCLAAIEILGEVGTQKSLPLLSKAQRSSNPEVREAAKEASEAIRGRTKKPG